MAGQLVYEARRRGDGHWFVVNQHGHPLADRRGTVREGRYILWETRGPDGMPCHRCATELRWDDDTVRAYYLDCNRDNAAIDNVVPMCQSCIMFLRHDRLDQEVVCAVCDVVYLSSRIDRMYCSRRCSETAQRRHGKS